MGCKRVVKVPTEIFFTIFRPRIESRLGTRRYQHPHTRSSNVWTASSIGSRLRYSCDKSSTFLTFIGYFTTLPSVTKSGRNWSAMQIFSHCDTTRNRNSIFPTRYLKKGAGLQLIYECCATSEGLSRGNRWRFESDYRSQERGGINYEEPLKPIFSYKPVSKTIFLNGWR